MNVSVVSTRVYPKVARVFGVQERKLSTNLAASDLKIPPMEFNDFYYPLIQK